MKTTLTLAAASLLFFGLTVAQPAMSQDKGGKTTQTGNRNQGKIRPNFVDANGDGICDNAGQPGHGSGTGVCDGTGKGAGKGMCDGTGKGAGKGAGTGTGTGTRQRLRDGSCINPAPVNKGVKPQNSAK